MTGKIVICSTLKKMMYLNWDFHQKRIDYKINMKFINSSSLLKKLFKLFYINL